MLPLAALGPEPQALFRWRATAPTPAVRDLFLAALLAAAFVLVPWESLSAQGFPDRTNYLAAIANFVAHGTRSFETGGASLLALLTNEYLWREILIFIGRTFERTLTGLALVSFVAVMLPTYRMLRLAGFGYFGYALVFLLCPLTVDLFISQSRSALAMALFIAAMPLHQRALRYVSFAAAFLIHTVAAIFVAARYIADHFLATPLLSSRLKVWAAFALGVGLSFVWVFLSRGIFALIGNRRAIQEEMLPTSIPFALWWIGLAVLLLSFARLRTPAQGQYVIVALVLLAMFISGTFLGVGSLRFLSLSLPFVLITVRSIQDPSIRLIALSGIVTFNLIHLTYWAV
jgi:hypothetical protein